MESMTLSSGSLLKHGEYRIVRVLGQGGFGITYEAEQVSLGRRVAVKEFFMKDCCNRDGSTSHVSVPSVGSRELVEKFRQKFLREARMIASMKNPHIVRVYDVFEENGTAYYVMEYLSGGSLADVVKHRGALPEPEALGYIRGIASALSSLHQRDTLHLDVKPSNVMLDEEGEVVLIDFGISKHIDSDGHLTSSTPIGVSKGYAPFEQMAHDDESTFSPATDIYSLGATLYYLLTAKTPRDASALLKSFPTDDLDANGVAPSLISAIRQSMSVAKEDRPQSVKAFLQLLDSEEMPPADDEDTLPRGEEEPEKPGKSGKTGKPEAPNKSANQATPSKPKKPVNQTKSATPKKPEPPKTQPKAGFPRWLWPVVAVLVVGAATFGLLRRPSSPSGGAVPPTDSVETVTEVIQQPEETEPVVQPTPVEPAVVALESLSLSKKNLELAEGASATLTAKYAPANVTDKSTTWQSSDESVAKVSPKGKVTAVSAGNAAITATCGGKTAYCNVTVMGMSIAQPETIEIQSLKLNKTSLELEENASATLTAKYVPANTTDKSTVWESSDESVATVNPQGKVTAVSAGNAAITAICGGKTAYCNVTVTPKSTTVASTTNATSTSVADKPSTTSTSGKENGHEWVDLGLSVKWATMNVGATSPEGYGSYFAWGETKPKSDYRWETYKWCTLDGSVETMKKYRTIHFPFEQIDSKKVLDSADDAARANWGGNWRMPTIDEIKELKANCTGAWTTQNGVKGYKFTSKINGNAIFLPAAGSYMGGQLMFACSGADYWSSSLYYDVKSLRSDEYAYCFGSPLKNDSPHYSDRCYGQSVRAVCP